MNQCISWDYPDLEDVAFHHSGEYRYMMIYSQRTIKMKFVKVLIIFIISVAIYLVVSQIIGVNREKSFFMRFDTTSINGELEYSKIGHHGSVFKIKKVEKEFVFYPITSDLNENKLFYNIAKKGDVVIKKPYSDTLKLIKKDKIYLYQFRKR